MTRNLCLYLPLLALAACTQPPSPAAADAAPAATAAPAVSAAAPAAQIAPVPAVPSVPAQPASDAQASGQDGERPTLMVTSTTGSIDCDGHNLDIVGRDANLVLRGQCGMIALLGANATLQIEHADGIRVVGDNAQVVMAGDARNVELFGRHGNLKIGRIETLAVPGDENQLRAVSIGSVTLHGRKNELTQQTGSAKVQDYGSDNRIAGN